MCLLQERGISALKLAQDTGIPKSIVYEWRGGVRMPSAENLFKLSRYFNVSLDALISVGESAQDIPRTAASIPDVEERELIILLREARKVSGEERERIIEKFRRGIDKYLTEGGKETGDDSQPAKKKRGRPPKRVREYKD